MIWFIIGGVLYTAVIVVITALIFLRRFDKLRMECFEKVVGSLHIEPADDGEMPMVFLELYKNTGDISGREFVHLAVETKSYVSQK